MPTIDVTASGLTASHTSPITLAANTVYDGHGTGRLRGLFKPSEGTIITNCLFDQASLKIESKGGVQLIRNRIVGTCPGFYAAEPTFVWAESVNGLVLDGNEFLSGNYGLIGWGWNNCQLVNNKVTNLRQWLHMLKPERNNLIARNSATRLIRMFMEVQRHGTPIADGLTVEDNTVSDWRQIYNDSFGFSIVPDYGKNVIVRRNYARLPGTLPPSDSALWIPGRERRGGYGIEAGFVTGEVSDNVIGGIFANGIVCSHPNTLVRRNKLFGKFVWNDAIETEPGPLASASWHDGGAPNLVQANYGLMPPVPGEPAPVPENLPPDQLSTTNATSKGFNLHWRDRSGTETGFIVEISNVEDPAAVKRVIIDNPNVTGYEFRGGTADDAWLCRVGAVVGTQEPLWSNVHRVRTSPEVVVPVEDALVAINAEFASGKTVRLSR